MCTKVFKVSTILCKLVMFSHKAKHAYLIIIKSLMCLHVGVQSIMGHFEIKIGNTFQVDEKLFRTMYLNIFTIVRSSLS